MKCFLIESDYKKCGVYVIKNTINKSVYVGGSCFLRKRFNDHKNTLSKRKHINDKLQDFVNENGIECLEFHLIELCSKDELRNREQFWLDKYECYLKGFNLTSSSVNSTGYKHSEAAKEMQSNRLVTKETRLKQSEWQKGKPKPQILKDKWSVLRKGRPKSESFKEKMRLSMKGNKNGCKK